MAEGEKQVVVADRQSLLVPVGHSVEDGQGQPANRKGRDQGQEHDVDPSAVVHSLAVGDASAVKHVLALP